MKKYRVLITALIAALILTAFSSCGKKNRQILGEGTDYPCEFVKKGDAYLLSVDSKKGYVWDHSCEKGGAFDVKTQRSDDKKTEYAITPGESGTLDKLVLTLEKNGAPIPMAAYRIEIIFFNEPTGVFSVFDSEFQPLTGDILYGEGTAMPYTLQKDSKGNMDITVLKPNETETCNIHVEDSSVLGIECREPDALTQVFTVFPNNAGSTDFYIALAGSTTALRFTGTVDKENGLILSEAELCEYDSEKAEIDASLAELEKTFGKIKLPESAKLLRCKSMTKAFKDNKTNTWAQFVLELPGDISAGYMIAPHETAERIKDSFAKGEAKKTTVGKLNGYSFKDNTGIECITWTSSDGSGAFIVTAPDAENAMETAEKLASLNTTVADVPLSEASVIPTNAQTEEETSAETELSAEATTAEQETGTEQENTAKTETAAEKEAVTEEETAAKKNK